MYFLTNLGVKGWGKITTFSHKSYCQKTLSCNLRRRTLNDVWCSAAKYGDTVFPTMHLWICQLVNNETTNISHYPLDSRVSACFPSFGKQNVAGRKLSYVGVLLRLVAWIARTENPQRSGLRISQPECGECTNPSTKKSPNHAQER